MYTRHSKTITYCYLACTSSSLAMKLELSASIIYSETWWPGRAAKNNKTTHFSPLKKVIKQVIHFHAFISHMRKRCEQFPLKTKKDKHPKTPLLLLSKMICTCVRACVSPVWSARQLIKRKCRSCVHAANTHLSANKPVLFAFHASTEQTPIRQNFHVGKRVKETKRRLFYGIN